MSVLLTIAGSGSFNKIGDGKVDDKDIYGKKEVFDSYNNYFPITLASKRINLPFKRLGGIWFSWNEINL